MHHAIQVYGGSGGLSPRIKVSTEWKWRVSVTPWPLHPQGKRPGNLSLHSWVVPRAGRTTAGNQTPVFKPVFQLLYCINYIKQHSVTENNTWKIMVGKS